MSTPIRLTKQQRQELVLTEVRASTSIRISALARQLGVAGETIRRDLAEMSEVGLISRTYGGATVSATTFEPMIAERDLLLVEERSRIGRRSVDLVRDGQVVMIDGGSTTQEVARHLAHLRRHLTLITNSTAIAAVASVNSTFRVILCPGVYEVHEGSVLGEDTVEFIGRYHADFAMFGASAATIEGPCDANSGAATVKRTMIRQAESAILVADSTKFGRRSFAQICEWDDVRHIVTDTEPIPGLAEIIRKAGTSIHIA